VVSLSSKSSKT
jgi:hypothetical protein